MRIFAIHAEELTVHLLFSDLQPIAIRYPFNYFDVSFTPEISLVKAIVMPMFQVSGVELRVERALGGPPYEFESKILTAGVQPGAYHVFTTIHP